MEKMLRVDFPFLNKYVEMPEGSKISDACDAAGHPLNLVCGGKGKCKKCAVDIEENGTVKNVISCQTEIFEGVKILLKDENIQAKILTESKLKDFDFNPCLSLKYISREFLKTEMGENDWDTIKKASGLSLSIPSLEIIRKLSKLFHNEDGITCVLYNDTLLDVLQGKKEEIFALAFDIGTTSVVGYLYNMKTYELIGVNSGLNKQTQIGGDVISRIDYTVNNTDGLDKLHSLVIATVNEIIDNICKDYSIDKNLIYQANFCGNSTMQHIFLKIYPEHLGKIPFSSTTHSEVLTEASELKLNINPAARVVFLPLLGGFVGADTTAVLTSLPNDDKSRLIIDLGTNGEIAAGKGNTYRVASTACGPALEGAGLTSGMRGTTGAIERFKIAEGDVFYKVLGDVKPKGICGSAIIDIVSELFDNGILTAMGAFCGKDEIKNQDLAKRIIPWEKSKAFIVCFKEETDSGKPILITQIDIRQVQLAKGAISTGCHMLVEKCCLSIENIDEILIAGAFGNYIDISKAQNIGMIPFHENVATQSIGNAAGTGCQMHLLSKDKQKFCNEIAKNATHVELASDPKFSMNYIMNTSFDSSEFDFED
ncbi:MAG: DUF4445 domain-containing protein [Spirochaetes bacterium]|nr:DUF4445 domain-containing protein [Spirochaetota bacterium]